MSYEDIVPYQFRSGDEAEKNGRKGGIASGAARRRKRSLKEAADLYLSLPVADTRAWNQMALDGIDAEDIDNQMAIIVGLSKRAMMGDAKAAKVVIDMLGENTRDDPVEDELAKARELLEGVDSVID